MVEAQTFLSPVQVTHKQYEALRAYYVDGLSATEAAEGFGYTVSSFYSLLHQVRSYCGDDPEAFARYFFSVKPVGRKPKEDQGNLAVLIVALRQQQHSVPEIKALLDTLGHSVSEGYVSNLLRRAGFPRLPRRTQTQRKVTRAAVKLEAPSSQMLTYVSESFSCQNSLGLLCLLPYLQQYGIGQLLSNSSYPETQRISRLNSLLSFIALKLSDVRRYSHDDIWCMDRGLGFFAGLNVLPKAAWLTSYSHRVTREMNLQLLRGLHGLWQGQGLLSDTANLDFTTLPYWGEAEHLENNWSGTRHQALSSILAVLAQDPDSGIITYSDTNIRHEDKNQVVLEFLDFYSTDNSTELKYLVFDSKFTTYGNLRKLDEKEVKFITIRRRGDRIIQELESLPASAWKTLRVPTSGSRSRLLKIYEQHLTPKDYGRPLRQIAISSSGRSKPALIITNDLTLPSEQIVRKYARRWLVEKGISQQIEFFHLNKLSDAMVIKVDFDLTMTLLAYNLLRLLAADLVGYSQATPISLYNQFLRNSGHVEILSEKIKVYLNKKRNLPALLTAMEPFQNTQLDTHQGLTIQFGGETRS